MFEDSRTSTRPRRGHFDLAVLMTFLAVVAVEAAVFVWQATPPGVEGEGTSHVAIGTRPPGFTLRRLSDNEQINLFDLRGKVVWMVFWGAWNEPSRRQLPELSKLYEKLKDDARFELVTVLCEMPTRDVGWDELMIPAAQEFMTKYKIDVPVYLDETGDGRRTFSILQEHFPTNVIIDAQGRVQGVWPNYFPELHRELLPVLNKWIDQTPPPKGAEASPAG
jgi:peroxiredoxin